MCFHLIVESKKSLRSDAADSTDGTADDRRSLALFAPDADAADATDSTADDRRSLPLFAPDGCCSLALAVRMLLVALPEDDVDCTVIIMHRFFYRNPGS